MAISGVVDLVAVTDEWVKVVDFKTDRGRQAEDEYRKQLSVYWHVLAATYPEKDVEAKVFWTDKGESTGVNPINRANLCNLVDIQSAG